MPTGYTADVGDGKVTDFREFAMHCARAFGALIEMRDEAPGAPIPDTFEPPTYNAQRLSEAQERLARLQSMDDEQIRMEATAAYDAALASHRASKRRRAEIRTRYEAMLDHVLAWEPPTPDHVEMKSFMVQQLEESIRFDCDFESPIPHRSEFEPKRWHAEEIARAERDVDYHTEQDAKEHERSAGRTAWVAALRASLAEVQS